MASRESVTIGRNLEQIFTGGSFVGLADGELLDRFARRADGAEGAFEALLERHGSAVLQACRRLGGNDGSAEDLFQATFIVLARKAGSLQVRDSLRPWLLEVARRTALKGRAGKLRRRAREQKVAIPEAIESPGVGLSDDEAPIVRAEVERLPAKYRDPVRLFYLEGRTQQETAEALGWPVGSVSGRLAEARKLLRARLARRGFAPMSGWLALPAAEVGSAVPLTLRLATLASATASTTGPSVAATLAAQILRGMAATKLVTQAACVAVALVALGFGSFSFSGPSEPLKPPAPQAPEPVIPEMIQAQAASVDRFGDPLPKGAIARLGSTRFRLNYFEDYERIDSLFYTPDGRSLGTVSSSGLGVSIWDAATGRRLRRLEVYRAVLSPDGQTLATVYHSGIIQLRDFRDGRELRQIASKNGESFDRLAFSPDGKTLVALSLKHAAEWKTDAALVGYETEGLTERFRRPGDFSKTRALVFAPDGKTLAMANPDRPDHPGFSMQEPDRSWIRLIDPQDGSEIRRITVDRFDVASLAFSPDGRTLAAGVSDRTVRLYDPATGEEQRPRLGEDHAMPPPKVGERPIKWYENAARAASALAFSPDGKILVSGQESVGYLNGRVDEASITVWDVPKRQELHRAFGHYGGINGLVFAPDGKTFASCGGDIAAKIWDASTGRETDPRPGHRATPHLLAVSPKDGTVFTGGSFDKVVLSWNPATGQCLGTAVDVPAGVLTLDVSPDGLSLLIDTWDGLTLWDLATRREIRRFSGKRPSHLGFYRASFSPDGKSVTMELKVWETATGRQLASFLDKQPDWPVVNSHYLCTRYTPDSQQLVSVETKGIRVLDIAAEAVAAIPVRRDFADPTRAAVSPDGRLVAVGNQSQTQPGSPKDRPDFPVRVYEVATGRQVFALEGHTDQITSLAFSPDGKTLATAAGDHWHPKDKTIRIWDTADGCELRRIKVAENGARQVAYLPNGRAIVSLGMDGVATVWDIAEIIPKR